MSPENTDLNLEEAANLYLVGLVAEKKADAHQEVNRFVRWLGRERLLSGITGYEVARYAEQLSPLATNYTVKVKLVRAFLVYIRKQGWCGINLASHLKMKKRKQPAAPASRRNGPRSLSLTKQGYDELKAELDTLRKRRLEVIDEMRRAAEDKDFRENAPLQAAREEQGHIQGRIMELEEAMKAAEIIEDKRVEKLKVSVGDCILLHELDSGEEMQYTIVSPREVAPAEGKISDASPVGKAVVGRSPGDEIDVVTPTGKLRCRIESIL